MVQILFSLLILLSFGRVAEASSCRLILETAPKIRVQNSVVTSRNFKKSIQYIEHQGLKVPFVDLRPTGRSNGKAVFLAAGFSKGMRSWIPHMRLLQKQGYRVISFDQTNIGYNLLENGIQKLDRGTGLDVDADLALAVLKSAGVSKKLTIMGHSRGAAVASRLALLSSGSSIIVDQLLLLTPYVRYLWSSTSHSEAFGESMYDVWSEIYPQTYGKFLHDQSKVKKYEVIDELPTYDLEAALVFVLKGMKLSDKAEWTTADILGEMLAQNKSIEITAFAAEQDRKLAPSEVVRELEQDRVEYRLFGGKNKDHYWPLHYAESMLKAVGLL